LERQTHRHESHNISALFSLRKDKNNTLKSRGKNREVLASIPDIIIKRKSFGKS
jgi:hypothetical protein